MIIPENISDYCHLAGHLRESNFNFIESYIKDNAVSVAIETGTIRGVPEKFNYYAGDGLSTVIFAYLSKKYSFDFYSVDKENYCIEQSQKIVSQFGLSDYVKYVNCDSVEFLKNFHSHIDILYLDSYDFAEGEEFNSQRHQLQEIINSQTKIKKNGIVFLDDCGIRDGGKCGFSSRFLTNNGYKIVKENYQRIYRKI